MLLIATVLGALTSCRGKSAAPVEVSPNVAVVLGAGVPDESGRAEAAAAHERWIDDATGEPDAVFRVLLLDGKEILRVTVPGAWGPDAIVRRTQFVAGARRAVAGLAMDGTARYPPGQASGSGDGRERVLLVQAARDGRARSVEVSGSGPPVQEAVVADVSDSGRGRTATGPYLAREYISWALAAACRPGSSFRVVRVGHSFDSAAEVFVATAPSAPCGTALTALLAREPALRECLGPGVHGSAIAEGLALAASRLAPLPGEKRIRLATDLREVAPGGCSAGRLNFERAVPSRDDFVAWLKDLVHSDLNGVSVAVCGVHVERAPRAGEFTRELARSVKEVWEAGLAASGARVTSITGDCKDAGEEE
jgi:hypothetical protein